MSSSVSQVHRDSRSIRLAAIVAAALSAPNLAPNAALAGPFVEPPVFASSNGVLDLLMVALPLPVTSLTYVPPNNAPAMNPTGWVYQICQRAGCDRKRVPGRVGHRLQLRRHPARVAARRSAQDSPGEPASAARSRQGDAFGDPGGANLPMNLTNLHTHGLIVPGAGADALRSDLRRLRLRRNLQPGERHRRCRRRPISTARSSRDMPITGSTSRPIIPTARSGSIRMCTGSRSTRCRSGSPASSRSAASANMRMATRSNTPFPDANVRHLVLKDMQVLAGGNIMFDNGPANVANGEVLNQEDPDFCNQFPSARHRGAPGFLSGRRQLRRRRQRFHRRHLVLHGERPAISDHHI